MKTLILDFDGTIAAIEEHTEAFKESLINGLSEKTGLRSSRVKKDFKDGEKKVIENRSEYGLVINGFTVAVADEDPYILYRSVAEALYKHYESYRFCGFGDFRNVFIEKAFNDVSPMPSSITRSTANILEDLAKKTNLIIVSNANKDRIRKALMEAGLNIPFIGKAGKTFIDPAFKKVGRRIEVGGFNIDIRRPRYYKILESIGGRKTVVGDVFSMDLSVPHRMGIDIMLKENSYTPDWSKDFVASEGRLVGSLGELLDFL